MTEPPRRLLALALVLALGCAATATTARAQDSMVGRQVTLFGVHATPGTGKDDPKLKEVLPQLRTLLPGHSFKLLKVESKRVSSGGVVSCNLGDGFVAATQLMVPLDPNGKVQMRFDLSQGGLSQYQTIVTTPPNQIFYLNRMFPNGERLILGVGAR